MRFYRNKDGGPILTEDQARAQYDGQAGGFYAVFEEIKGDELAKAQINHIIATHAPADSYKYQMLDRLRTDCEYFLGNGDRQPSVLWAGSVGTQLEIMRTLLDSFPEEDRPEWLTAEDLEEYRQRMADEDSGKLILIDWKQYARDFCGYEVFTTFGNDFDIADRFGKDAIRDTFNRAFNEWKSDYKYLTELVLILNWKISQHYNHNNEYARLYNDLWAKADSYALDSLTGEELTYFYQVTD